jgi:hypothetical protein
MFRSAVLAAFTFAAIAIPTVARSQISIGVAITVAPPELPIYDPPVCPEPNYLWTPGFWAWGPDGYYWVPGAWVPAPEPGLLWTPGYWGFDGGHYGWHDGYWGPHVGFYGGVNYGYGYYGNGFAGGEWRGGNFAYNTAVVHVNRTIIHNTYINRTVIRNTHNSRASFNGRGGISARPTAQQQRWGGDRHVAPTQMQVQHARIAGQDRSNFASVNHGRPAHAAVERPVSNVSELNRGVAARGGARPSPATHPAPRPNTNRSAPNRPDSHADSKPGSRPDNNRPGNTRPENNRPENSRPGNDHPVNPRPTPGARPPANNNIRRVTPRPAPSSNAGRPANPPRPSSGARPAETHPNRPASPPHPANTARPQTNSRPSPQHSAPAARPQPSHPAPNEHAAPKQEAHPH